MSDDTRKGLMRAIGADTIGGPVDTIIQVLKNTPPTLLPPGLPRLLGQAAGLPSEPILPKEMDESGLVGSSEWIAGKTGVQGSSPEYNAARLGGNLGLMALPWAWGKVRDFNPRQGQLNMWLGPLAKDYDQDKAEKVSRAYERFMQATDGKQKRAAAAKLKAMGMDLQDPFVDSSKLSGVDVDRFNTMAFRKYQTIMEPASRKALQFYPEKTDALDPAAVEGLKQGQAKYLEELYPDPALQQYPGLGKTFVEPSHDSKYLGSFSADPSVRTTSPGAVQTSPFREGTMELNAEAHYPSRVNGPDGLAIQRGLMANTVRHEAGHSIQASEKLPRGGSASLMKDLGEALDSEAYLTRGTVPALTPGDGSAYWVDKGRKSATRRAISDPDEAYKSLVGERLSQSAEVHNQPLDMVAEYGIPKFDKSLVLDQGKINPIHLYTRGHLPPYTGANPDPILGFKQAAEETKAGGIRLAPWDDEPGMGAEYFIWDLPSLKPRGSVAKGLLSQALAETLKKVPPKP